MYIYVKMKIDFDMMYSYNISYIFVIYKMIGNILCIVRIYVYIDIYTTIKINIIYDGKKNKKIYIVI
jgi:hypothetical protein